MTSQGTANFRRYYFLCVANSNKMKYIAAIFLFGLWNMATDQNHCMPKDCFDLRCYRLSEGIDGPHIIYPERENLPSLEVSCDQDAHGGGWIMFQRRVDGKLNFTRTWDEYRSGFGNNGGNTTELWLGLEPVYQLLHSFGGREVTLRIELDAFDGNVGWVEAYAFRMRGAKASYRLYWLKSRGATQMMADSWDFNKEHAFKTFDATNGEGKCLKKFKGGWWYSRPCDNAPGVHMNGDYLDKVHPGIYVRVFKSVALQQSRMMFRTTSIVRACVNPCKHGGACVCKFEFCGAECELANPCMNGGTCEYDEMTNIRTCKCSAKFCGPKCELENTCKNGGTCEYDETTKSTT